MEEQGSIGVVPGVKVPVGAIYLALPQPNCPDAVRAGSDPFFYLTNTVCFVLEFLGGPTTFNVPTPPDVPLKWLLPCFI